MNIQLNSYTDEFELVEGCRKGIPAAQNALYRQYTSALLILCMRYVGDAEDAKDVLMEALVNAYRNFDRFDYLGPGSLQAWLKRLAVNQCLMLLRKRKLQFRELDEIYEEQIADADNDGVISGLSIKEIMLLIQELPPGYRTVFNLYVFEEMTHKEIAGLLRISENTSKSQLHKARGLLQKQLVQSQRIVL